MSSYNQNNAQNMNGYPINHPQYYQPHNQLQNPNNYNQYQAPPPVGNGYPPQSNLPNYNTRKRPLNFDNKNNSHFGYNNSYQNYDNQFGGVNGEGYPTHHNQMMANNYYDTNIPNGDFSGFGPNNRYNQSFNQGRFPAAKMNGQFNGYSDNQGGNYYYNQQKFQPDQTYYEDGLQPQMIPQDQTYYEDDSQPQMIPQQNRYYNRQPKDLNSLNHPKYPGNNVAPNSRIVSSNPSPRFNNPALPNQSYSAVQQNQPKQFNRNGSVYPPKQMHQTNQNQHSNNSVYSTHQNQQNKQIQPNFNKSAGINTTNGTTLGRTATPLISPTTGIKTDSQIITANPVVIWNDINLVLSDTTPTLNKPFLRAYHENYIMFLIEGKQCLSCGKRFAKDEKDLYAKHLDWHFISNKNARNPKVEPRGWYAKELWTNLTPEKECIIEPSVKTVSNASTTIPAKTESIPKIDAKKENKPIATVQTTLGQNDPEPGTTCAADLTKSDDENCKLCRERFKQFWHLSLDEWHYEDAIRVDGETYHSECRPSEKS